MIDEFNTTMLEEQELPEITFKVNDDIEVKFDMTLPLQVLFDDVMTFVSETDI
ncbi:hypothetical protein IJF81_01415 [bacterium]|nr:hypothetical protein [bacterium]